MQIHISLDYELFLQDPGINVSSSLIEPTNRLNKILDKNSLKAIYFVDAGYLAALHRQKSTYVHLQSDYAKIVDQLNEFDAHGHEIGLHIHPHWEDTFFDGARWLVDLSRYKLADFHPTEASKIFKEYHAILQRYTREKIVSYRAGGWCLEPFSSIRSAMKECGVFIDSTVYQDGQKQTATHSFDFRGYPKKDIWRFENHPSIEDKNGTFVEIPSTAHALEPVVYWRLMFNAFFKKLKKSDSGYAVKPSFKEALSKLFFATSEAVSIDSLKSNSLMTAFRNAENIGQTHFCIIGHPKCFTEDTYRNLTQFVDHALAQGHTFYTFFDSLKQSDKTI